MLCTLPALNVAPLLTDMLVNPAQLLQLATIPLTVLDNELPTSILVILIGGVAKCGRGRGSFFFFTRQGKLSEL